MTYKSFYCNLLLDRRYLHYGCRYHEKRLNRNAHVVLLCEEDTCGYQLVQKIKERSKGLITVQEGSFYPLLYRLADDGYITGQEIVTRMSTGRSRMRVIYHIENAGRERLASLKKDYETVQQGIHNILDS